MAESHHIAHLVAGIVALLVVALVILAGTRRIRLPFTIALVLAGLTLTALTETHPHLFPPLHGIRLSPGLVLYVFLPVLIFESAFNLDARTLRRNLLPVLLLAVPGLLLSTTLIGLLVAWATGIPLASALLLGSILSATDPVAVVALFKKLGAPLRLTILVEGESLFNDASAIVVSRILLGVVMGGTVSLQSVGAGVGEFFYVFFGGLAVGAVMALATAALLGAMETDTNVALTLTGVLAYGSFLVAEELTHTSGVMATIAAAIVFGTQGRMKLSATDRPRLEHGWEYAGFLANALIFLLVGLEVNLVAIAMSWSVLLWVIAAMLVSRTVVVYGLLPLAERLPGFEVVDQRFRHVMFWGGLRGAIALALVMSLPEFEHRELFITVTIGAVLFTLVFQGLSIEELVRRLRLDRPHLADRVLRLEGDLAARQKALERLPELLAGGLFSGAVGDRLRHQCETELTEAKHQIEALRRSELHREQERQLLELRCLNEEHSIYQDLFNHGQISEAAFARLLTVLRERIDSVRHEGGDTSPLSSAWWRDQRERLLARLVRIPLFRRPIEPFRRRLIARDYEEDWARCQGARRAVELIDELTRLEAMEKPVVGPLRDRFLAAGRRYRDRLDLVAEQFPEFVSSLHERLGRRLVLMAELDVVEERAAHGVLPRPVADQIEDQLRRKLQSIRDPVAPPVDSDPTALLARIPLFENLPASELPRIAARLQPFTVREGEAIVQQGERGDSMFLIARGVVRICREADGHVSDLATLMAGDFFGEIALLQGETRSASVRAVTPCSLYEISKDLLDRLLAENSDMKDALEQARQHREAELAAVGIDPEALLRGSPLFETLPPTTVKSLASRMQELHLGAQAVIFHQGDEAHALYLIAQGVVRVTLETRGRERQLATLTQGSYFGEGGLLHQRRRGATVRTVSPCVLYQLRREDLDRLIKEEPVIGRELSETDRFRSADTRQRRSDDSG